MTRTDWLTTAVASLTVVLFLGWLQDGTLWAKDGSVPQNPYQPVRDIQVVWVAERAFLSGVDPSKPLEQLFDEFRVPVDSPSILDFHPRLPSGYLLESWVALLPQDRVVASSLAVTAFGLALILGLAGILRGSPIPIFVYPLLPLTGAVNSLVFWRSTSWMVSASMIGCWVLARRRDGPLPGLALVPAIGTRLFPLVLVPVLWIQGRRKAAVWAILGTVSLNVVGLIPRNVSLQSTLGLLTADRTEFLASQANGSLWAIIMRPGGDVTLALLAVLLLTAGFWRLSQSLTFDRAFGLGLVVALLVTPLAWGHFRLVQAAISLNPFGVLVWVPEFAAFVWPDWEWIAGFSSTLLAAIGWYLFTSWNSREVDVSMRSRIEALTKRISKS